MPNCVGVAEINVGLKQSEELEITMSAPEIDCKSTPIGSS